MGNYLRLSVLPVLLLSGCQSTATVVADSEMPSPSESQSVESPQPLPDDKSVGESERDQQKPIECPDKVLADIEQTIESQTIALGEGDYELAYAIASPSFQTNVTLEGFIDIISTSYGPLISSSSLVFSDCLTNSEATAALLDVRFIQRDNVVYGLRYLMVNFEGTWRVDGASNLQIVGEGT